MFVRSSLFVVFLNILLTNVKCSVISYSMVNERILERRTREASSIINSSNWMKNISKLNEDLLNIQAVIVKDEELKGKCMTGSKKG